MRKWLAIVLCMVLLFAFSGCVAGDSDYDPNSTGKAQAEIILRCFDEDDIDGLRSLFCQPWGKIIQ